MMRTHTPPAFAVLTILAATPPVMAAFFHGFDLPMGYFGRAISISPDGSTVMGDIWAPQKPGETFRWSEADGFLRQENIPNWGGYGWSYGMSYDGSIVIGYDKSPAISYGHAFKWTAGGGREYLDDPAEVIESGPWAISWDGEIIAGYRKLGDETEWQAVVWQHGHPLPLEQAPGSGRIYPLSISSTGTVVGFRYDSQGLPQPFRWAEPTGLEPIALPDIAKFVGAVFISADGQTIAGNWATDAWYEGFILSGQTGAMGLGDLPGGRLSSNITGISADGRIIVGISVIGEHDAGGGLIVDTTTAFIWDAEHGMRSLPDVLTNEYGLDLQGWELWEAMDVSADGRTIIGNGIDPDGYWRPWVARIPEPATAGLLLMLLILQRRPVRHSRESLQARHR